MPLSHEDASYDDPQLNEILAKYLRATEAGEAVDHEQFLREHPDYADELRDFFADKRQLDQLAGGLHPAAVAADAVTLPPQSATHLDAATLAPGSATRETPQPGTVIRYFGDYELLEEIARGGMGVVYKARQVKLNRIVAIKMILSGQLASKEDVQRFYTEAEAAAGLDHPGIVPIYEVGEHDGQHYFSMGFVDGPSLSSKLADHPLAPREAADLVARVAQALQYAHDKGVIHRDLKPANVLLDKDGQPKVTDFGLAKKLEGDSNLTGTGQILGTPSYMPPEQAAGRLSDVCESADVYSLGAILYATLTGRPPFQADNPLDTLMQVLEREPVSPRTLNAKVPADLETVCLKCLEKDRRRRYDSARSLADELQRFLNGEPILARPISRTARAWRWCKRKPVVSSLSAALVLAVVFGFVGITWQWRRAEDSSRRAQHSLYGAHMNLAAQAMEAKNSIRAMQLLDRYRGDPATENLRSFEWFHLWRSLYPPVGKRFPSSGKWANPLALSRDGSRLAVRIDEKTALVWDVAAEKVVATIEPAIQTKDGLYAAFSPDGKSLALGGNRISLCNLATGQQTILSSKELPARPFFNTTSLQFSADGSLLVSASGKLAVWDVITGELKAALEDKENTGDRIGVAAISPDGTHVAGIRQSLYESSVKTWIVATGEPTTVVASQKGSIADIEFTPDSLSLAVPQEDAVCLYSVPNGELKTRWNCDPAGTVHSMQFSLDGTHIAVGGSGAALILETDSGATAVSPLSFAVTSVQFASDGRAIAFGSQEKAAVIWEMGSRGASYVLEGHGTAVGPLAISPDGTTLASGDDSGTINLWNVDSGTLIKSIDAHDLPVVAVGFLTDNTTLVTCGEDRQLKVWKEMDAAAESFSLGKADIIGARFSPDGSVLAAATREKRIDLIDTMTGNTKATIANLQSFAMAFSPDSATLAVHDGRTESLWDVRTGRLEKVLNAFSDQRYPGDNSMALSIAFSQDGKQLAVGSFAGNVRIWDVSRARETLRFQGEFAAVPALAFAPDGKSLAIANRDLGDFLPPATTNQFLPATEANAVILWDVVTGEPKVRYRGLATNDAAVERQLRSGMPSTRTIVFSRDGITLAATSGRVIQVWRAARQRDVPAKLDWRR